MLHNVTDVVALNPSCRISIVVGSISRKANNFSPSLNHLDTSRDLSYFSLITVKCSVVCPVLSLLHVKLKKQRKNIINWTNAHNRISFKSFSRRLTEV